MTPDEIDRLTIAEVRAIAERAHEALSRLREVQSLLGGAAGTQQVQLSPVVAVVPPSNGTRTRTPISDAELADMKAQKAALLARNLPDEILKAEGLST